MKTAFAIGKSDRKTRRLIFLTSQKAPIVGPFVLKAVVTK